MYMSKDTSIDMILLTTEVKQGKKKQRSMNPYLYKII